MASRNFILNNFAWKLLSLLLAALTWLSIEVDFQKDEIRKKDIQDSPVITTSHRTFSTVPLELLTAATGTNRFRTSPLTVSVELSGSADDLRKLMPSDVEAVVDVTDAEDEARLRRKIRVNVPRDIQVVSVTPQYAGVELITGPK